MNAFLHSYWNASIFQRLVAVGYTTKDAEIATWAVTTAHELGARIEKPWHMTNIVMDLHNNKLGIQTAVELEKENYGIFDGNDKQRDLILELLTKIEKGEAYRISKINYDPSDGFNSPKAERISEDGLMLYPTNGEERIFMGSNAVDEFLKLIL